VCANERWYFDRQEEYLQALGEPIVVAGGRPAE